ncbi:ROK family protein [Haloplasma contractile]|uniref:Carbohydrate transport protein n=1 Tax=Haloplasma contractile SSD-17B TaxID=1033810 RepID=U2FRR5_9MOLU|nr:ROK family protein [Haloplasma contractile]ERJ13654.1 Carbohydrate transport protein [Haloplasma contractile SSD-17B]
MTQVIGIDIGGTEIKGAVLSLDGTILYESRVKTDTRLGRDSILNGLNQLIEEFLFRYDSVVSIGIGSAGRINVAEGTVAFATDNLPGWNGFHLKEYIENQFNLPVAVENDANVALIGEAYKGVGKLYNDIVMLTLGTGVGGANIVNGKIQNGKDYHAGEWGHVVLYPNGRICNCGQKGCIEQYLSGTALVRRINELGYNIGHGSEIFKLIERGNKDVSNALNEYIDDLIIVLHNISLSINPELIIIGGGVVHSRNYWWPILENKLKENDQIKCLVQPAKLENTAGIIGAGKIALNVLEK